MEAASGKIILERLKEEWTDVSDPAVYKDLEFEKQLWMLMGLKHLVSKANLKAMEDGDGVVGRVKSLQAGKVLSLYETQGKLCSTLSFHWGRNVDCISASATYLSTLPPTPTETHHHSPTPATSVQIPSLRTLLTPTPLARLPYAANFFTTVSSLPLVATLPFLRSSGISIVSLPRVASYISRLWIRSPKRAALDPKCAPGWRTILS
jgi:hypothetical protein